MIRMILALWFPVAAWAQDCPPASSTDLSRSIDEAEATIARLDLDAFKAATDELGELMPCLDDPVTRNVAAEVHRFMGIRAFADGRRDDATVIFRAARVLEPGYSMPDSLIPAGNPIRAAYEEVEFGEPDFDKVPPPADGGYVQLDGRTTTQRPRTWATVYQRFDGKGALVESAYLMPADPVPEYAIKLGEEIPEIPYDDPVFIDKKPTALLGATVAAGVTTGVLYALAGVNHAKFNNSATPDGQLDPAADRANALTIASAVTGTATLGLGIGVALRW